jgi:hypothetical protein
MGFVQTEKQQDERRDSRSVNADSKLTVVLYGATRSEIIISVFANLVPPVFRFVVLRDANNAYQKLLLQESRRGAGHSRR